MATDTATQLAWFVPYLLVGNLIIYNVAIIKLLTVGFQHINMTEALSEKSMTQPAPPPPAPPPPAPPPPAGMLLAVAPAGGIGVPPAPLTETSYSRVSGFVGAIVIAVFFWALGNVILFKAFADVAGIRELVSGLGTYFLTGASLFLPYAFNQLSGLFK